MKYLIPLLLVMCLSGCGIETAFVAGAATGASIINDKRNLNTIVEDKNITHQANNAIEHESDLTGSHLVVSSYNHIVLLTGQVTGIPQRERALDIVKQITNVKRVYNELQIAPATSTLTRSNDAWITTKIRGKMLITKELHSGQIKVVTENSTVYLLGLVTPRQGEIAADITREIPGVQRVVKLFEYVSVIN